jgi:hypothetical protein
VAVATTLPDRSKDWSKAGAPLIIATTTIPMNFFRTRSIVVPDDEHCHHLVCALKQIGMCEAEHSARGFLAAISAAKFKTSALAVKADVATSSSNVLTPIPGVRRSPLREPHEQSVPPEIFKARG